MNLKKIEGEEIARLHFLPVEEQEQDSNRAGIDQKLKSGAILGNLEKEKCKIVVHTLEGDKYIETIISAVTDKYLCIKGGMTILIASIIDVII